MASRIAVILGFFSGLAFASEPILLDWDISDSSQKSPSCHELVRLFIEELRDIAVDQRIELNLEKKDQKENSYKMKCQENNIYLSKGEKKFTLHYHKARREFEASDWLVFQKSELRDAEENTQAVTFSDLAPKNDAGSENIMEAQMPETNTNAIYKKWWFWGGVGLMLSGGYLFYKHQNRKTGVNVEIH
ncbi:MAG: hypothetical protein AB7F43_00870 [Bacteriovoracia bacterium]